MSRRTRSGFTLVELLVVITIIGILAGMLFPAVQSMRASARQTECLNNIGQCSKAIMAYETSKQRFPGIKNVRPNAPGVNTVTLVGWVPPLLTQLGRADIYNQYMDPVKFPTWPPLDSSTPPQPLQLGILACPADKEIATQTVSGNTMEIGRLNFVLNGGMKDNFDAATKTNIDYVQNGIGFDRVGTSGVTSSVSYVANKDGVATTLLLLENADADRPEPVDSGGKKYVGWDGYVVGNDLQTAQTTWNDHRQELLQSVVWLDVEPQPIGLNKDIGGGTGIDQNYARPSSFHSGGFHVTFCDSHAKFLSDEIDYKLYAELMTADGRSARLPANGNPVVYPWPAVTISDKDIQ